MDQQQESEHDALVLKLNGLVWEMTTKVDILLSEKSELNAQCEKLKLELMEAQHLNARLQTENSLYDMEAEKHRLICENLKREIADLMNENSKLVRAIGHKKKTKWFWM